MIHRTTRSDREEFEQLMFHPCTEIYMVDDCREVDMSECSCPCDRCKDNTQYRFAPGVGGKPRCERDHHILGDPREIEQDVADFSLD
jgi:hypothetical protein